MVVLVEGEDQGYIVCLITWAQTYNNTANMLVYPTDTQTTGLFYYVMYANLTIC